jgi:hypothetical protein
MERMTREQMVAEFGAPGVENPKLLDLVTVDPATGNVVLAMFERRPWGASPRQFQEIEEKINRYMGYALDGFLVQHHPEYEGKRVVLRLDCVEAPAGEAARFVAAARHATQAHGMDFLVNVTELPA